MDEKLQPKPLSSNAFFAFFQKIWRWWLGVWYGFSAKHPKLAGIVYMVFFFIVFSEGVTIVQFVIMTYLPLAFTSLNNGAFGWAPFQIMGVDCTVLGDANGLGYYLAYQISGIVAQCINFPLQRNITYRSHGNPWYQAMWYFIGYVLVNIVAMGLIWGVVNCFLINWGWYDGAGLETLAGLLKTFLTGGVAMAVFFFIFLVIFPNVDKDAASKKAKYEAAIGTPNEAKAKLTYEKAEEVRLVFYAEKYIAETTTLAETKIAMYVSAKKQFELGKVTEEQVEAAKAAALEAVEKRDTTVAEQTAILNQVKAAREARA